MCKLLPSCRSWLMIAKIISFRRFECCWESGKFGFLSWTNSHQHKILLNCSTKINKSKFLLSSLRIQHTKQNFTLYPQLQKPKQPTHVIGQPNKTNIMAFTTRCWFYNFTCCLVLQFKFTSGYVPSRHNL